MSLLKWKEMAAKRSELGQRINEVKKTIKQKSISDQIGQVEAAKLFEPITSGLKDITAPKIPLRRLLKKKGPTGNIPDYGIALDDEDIPDFDLENLFGDEVPPQNNKQLVWKPPSYEDVLKEIASGEKKMYINPEYMPQPNDLPPEKEEEEEEEEEEEKEEKEEEEGHDYAIFEEDRINEALDGLSLPNYVDVELRLTQEDMNNKKRKAYLNTVIKNAKDQRKKLNGYSANVTKKLKSGSISEAEAQMKRKVILDTRKVLTEYIDYNNQKLSTIKGSGLKKKTKRGGQVMFFINPTEMIKKLELIIGSMAAGNNSIELRNTGVALLDILFRNSMLNRSQYNKIYKNYFYVN